MKIEVDVTTFENDETVTKSFISEVNSFQEARNICNRIARYQDVIDIYWKPIKEDQLNASKKNNY